MSKKKLSRGLLKENAQLYLMLLPVLVLIFLMAYLPLFGLTIAFEDYYPGASIFSFDNWVGLDNFIRFFKGRNFWRLTRNTLTLNLLYLAISFPLPIIFSLLLNEIKSFRFKKFAQTVSYLPYFISTVIIASIVMEMVSVNGLFNKINTALGKEVVDYIVEPKAFPWIYALTMTWKSFGWNSILFLSSMTAIDTSYYESAKLDGANRFQLMWHITLPCILPTIMIVLILDIGKLMGGNSDLILLMYNPGTYETADILATYIYRDGILGGRFSMSAAVGLFQSIINFVLVFTANKVSDKITGNGLW